MTTKVTERNAILTQADGTSWSFGTESFCTDTTRWLLEDIPGWYGGSGVRSSTTDRYRHGDFPSRGWREGRTLSIRGATVSVDSFERDDIERELSGIMWDGEIGTLAVQESDDRVLWTTVRLDGAPSIEKLDERHIAFSIPLRTAEPFVYGPWRETTLTPLGVGIGLEYPLFTGGVMPSKINGITDPLGLDPTITSYRTTASPGWAAVNGEWVKTGDISGSNAIRLNPDADSFYSDIPLVPGKRYRMTVEVYLDAGTGQVRFAPRSTLDDGSQSYDGDGPEAGGDPGHFTDVEGTGEWVEVTRWWDAPENGVSASFDVQINSVSGATEVKFRNPTVRSTEPILTFGSAIDTDVSVWNDGNVTSYPQFAVVADAPGGFALTMGDRRVTYPWATFPDMPVLVDMNGTLLVSGQDQSHRLGERGWSGIEPNSVETPKLDFLQGGTGWATARHRDTYI